MIAIIPALEAEYSIGELSKRFLSNNIIILDKNRIARAIIKERIPEDQVAELVQLIIDLQNN